MGSDQATTNTAAERMKPYPGLYRAQLACKIGRDALEGTLTPPPGCTPAEWALFNLLTASEEIAKAMQAIAGKQREMS